MVTGMGRWFFFFPRTSPGKHEISCSASEKIFQDLAERPVLSRKDQFPDLSRGSLEGLQGSLAPSTSLSFPLRSLFVGHLPQGLIYLPNKSSAVPKPYEEYGCRLSKNSPQTASSVPSKNLLEMQIPSPQSGLRNRYFNQPTRGFWTHHKSRASGASQEAQW